MKVNHVFYGKFHLAGISVKHKEFDRVKDELQVGSELNFLRESDNAYDPYAIQVYYKGYKLGYVEKKDLNVNRKYARLLDAHLTELFYATVASVNYKKGDPEYQVEVNVFIRLDGTKYFSLTEEEERMIADVKDLDLSPVLRAFRKGCNTLGKLLDYKNADAAFTCKWELKDILAIYDPSPEEPRLGIKDDEDDTIGEYFTSYNGKTSSTDEKLVDYPLLCVYLNRIHRHHAAGTNRMYSICSTFIHECMHALFDHEPDKLAHPSDSYLEEPTCECGTIMIAEHLEKMHPEYVGFADWMLNAVDSKVNKYGLGADLFRYWTGGCQEDGDNAVDAYNDACDFIELKNGAAVSWTGRMDHLVAIPEMKEIYNSALCNRVSNQGPKA